MTFKGPFQPKLFYDTIIQSLSRYLWIDAPEFGVLAVPILASPTYLPKICFDLSLKLLVKIQSNTNIGSNTEILQMDIKSLITILRPLWSMQISTHPVVHLIIPLFSNKHAARENVKSFTAVKVYFRIIES